MKKTIFARVALLLLLPLFAAEAMAVNYRYVRWSISERRTSDCCVQVAELRLTIGGTPVAWDGGVTTAGYPTGSADYESPSGEQSFKLVDGLTDKWLVFLSGGTSLSPSVVVTIDNTTGITFDGYQYQTAVDETGRDPVSWTLEGSNDGSSWTLLDTRTSESITSSRNAWTSVYAIPSGGLLLRRRRQ